VKPYEMVAGIMIKVSKVKQASKQPRALCFTSTGFIGKPVVKSAM